MLLIFEAVDWRWYPASAADKCLTGIGIHRHDRGIA